MNLQRADLRRSERYAPGLNSKIALNTFNKRVNATMLNISAEGILLSIPHEGIITIPRPSIVLNPGFTTEEHIHGRLVRKEGSKEDKCTYVALEFKDTLSKEVLDIICEEPEPLSILQQGGTLHLIGKLPQPAVVVEFKNLVMSRAFEVIDISELRKNTQMIFLTLVWARKHGIRIDGAREGFLETLDDYAFCLEKK